MYLEGVLGGGRVVFGEEAAWSNILSDEHWGKAHSIGVFAVNVYWYICSFGEWRTTSVDGHLR